VFTIAIVFDVAAAVLAFFVLRRMKVPRVSDQPVFAGGTPAPAVATLKT
jgi:hypothetical protein